MHVGAKSELRISHCIGVEKKIISNYILNYCHDYFNVLYVGEKNDTPLEKIENLTINEVRNFLFYFYFFELKYNGQFLILIQPVDLWIYFVYNGY
ncbi:hypothetical protein QFZ81_004918 [Paenibacillus sp. V4I9]|nr:hypothetical protein [Paenibacillus sp. V4I9]